MQAWQSRGSLSFTSALAPALAAGLAGLAAMAGCAGEDPLIAPSTGGDEVLGQVADQWVPDATQPPIRLLAPDGAEFAPVHATLMPDGRIAFMGLKVGTSPAAGVKAGLITPTPLGQTPPAQRIVTAPPMALDAEAVIIDEWFVDDTLFCAGQTLLADGRLFVAGGMRVVARAGGAETHLFGLSYASLFDGATWTRGSDMVATAEQGEPLRWYPTTTRLADGRVLVTSGRDYVASMAFGQFVAIGTENLSVELYDPATGAFSLVAPYGQTPDAVFNPDYTHAFQLPYPTAQFPVMMFGERGEPVFMALDGAFVASGDLRPDTALDGQGQVIDTPNNGASTTLLPIRAQNLEWGYFNGAALIAGGTHLRPHEHAIDVYDPVASAWLPRIDMEVRRHHPSTVILPDGRILIVAGHDDVTGDPRVRKAQYVDPAAGFAVSEGISEMAETRGYHTFSLLLPDGRVIVGGGRTAGPDSTADEKPDFRYYHPPYLSQPRPQITAAPATIGYGQGFFFTWAGPDVDEVVLIGLGSMTHSIDMNQRYVQLPVFSLDPQGDIGIAIGPADAATAPPGHYMLFVLDANRVPSIAQIVKVE